MRISTTILDSFYRYHLGTLSYNDLMERITGSFEGNYYTERGTAFHSIVENYDGMHYSYKEFTFNKEGIDIIVNDIEDYKKNGIAEVKAAVITNIYGVDITLVGKADYWKPNSILELKTTNFYNAENYEDSLQWKCYMYIFGVKEVIYKVATLDANEDDKSINITAINQLTKTYYEDIVYEIKDILSEFIKFIYTNNLRGLF